MILAKRPRSDAESSPAGQVTLATCQKSRFTNTRTDKFKTACIVTSNSQVPFHHSIWYLGTIYQSYPHHKCFSQINFYCYSISKSLLHHQSPMLSTCRTCSATYTLVIHELVIVQYPLQKDFHTSGYSINLTKINLRPSNYTLKNNNSMKMLFKHNMLSKLSYLGIWHGFTVQINYL